MKPALIDTDILSMFLKGNTKVKENFKNHLKSYNYINFSIITYYEILSGLKHKDANKKISSILLNLLRKLGIYLSRFRTRVVKEGS